MREIANLVFLLFNIISSLFSVVCDANFIKLHFHLMKLVLIQCV
ncbi:hypothetical protein PPAR_a2040 [Pseudoalteromonas paragorgicola KMM 3548]|nr:hypothetical protein [Pseudoalteromonas distincta KMM 3548]